jgi:hypothetical protein
LTVTVAAHGDGTAVQEMAREVTGPRVPVRVTSPSTPAQTQNLCLVLEHMVRNRVAEIGLSWWSALW